MDPIDPDPSLDWGTWCASLATLSLALVGRREIEKGGLDLWDFVPSTLDQGALPTWLRDELDYASRLAYAGGGFPESFPSGLVPGLSRSHWLERVRTVLATTPSQHGLPRIGEWPDMGLAQCFETWLGPGPLSEDEIEAEPGTETLWDDDILLGTELLFEDQIVISPLHPWASPPELTPAQEEEFLALFRESHAARPSGTDDPATDA